MGSSVRFAAEDDRLTKAGASTIVRLLPESYEGPLYRLQSEVDGHERVAPEALLRLAPASARKPDYHS